MAVSHDADRQPAEPAVPVPDDKDWTWVLERPCPECGFDASGIHGERIGGLVRETAGAWQAVLAGADIRRRPSPDTWSALEYGAHCRDVYAIFAERVRLMLIADDPQFANWDQDATALEKRYWESDPATVSTEIMVVAGEAAQAFDNVEDDQWSRTGRRSNGSAFTVETLGRYFVHDLVHHLHDVGRPLT